MWARIAEAVGETVATALAFAGVGSFIGVGRLMNSGVPLSVRLVIGRAISTAGLSMAAGAVLVWIPGLDRLALLGVAAALASIGTSGIERILTRVLGGRRGSDES